MHGATIKRERELIYCAVRIGYLNTIHISLNL